MTDTNGPTPDQMAVQVRTRMESIDKEIEALRAQRTELSARIKTLTTEKEKWARMLPRAPRKRSTVGQQTLPS